MIFMRHTDWAYVMAGDYIFISIDNFYANNFLFNRRAEKQLYLENRSFVDFAFFSLNQSYLLAEYLIAVMIQKITTIISC